MFAAGTCGTFACNKDFDRPRLPAPGDVLSPCITPSEPSFMEKKWRRATPLNQYINYPRESLRKAVDVARWGAVGVFKKRTADYWKTADSVCPPPPSQRGRRQLVLPSSNESRAKLELPGNGRSVVEGLK